MKIIITGAKGFVGRNLKDFFFNRKNAEIDVSILSLRDEGWLERMDSGALAIVHLAGKAHDTSNTAIPSEYFKINRDLTVELFDNFLGSEVRDFFFFSSVKAVADTVVDTLMEEHQANPLTPYGKSKLEAEEYLLSKELPKGKRLFIIRPCMIHGPGNKGNLNLLFNFVKNGIPWPLGAFENRRSFLGIDNLCFLIESILRNEDFDSGIYNFADDDAISTNELVGIISETLGKNTRIWRLNKGLIEKLAHIGDKLTLPLNSERLKKLTESYVVSNQKIKNGLGIESLPTSVKEGLRNTIRSFHSKTE